MVFLAQKWRDKISLFNPISIKGESIPFSNQAEHVGVTRSPDGNLPHILGRILAHKKSKGVTLHSGTAQNHRGNPAASVLVQRIYNTPVLFSGVSSLLLTSSEINSIDSPLLF